MSYQASCHCGAVVVTVDSELPDKAIECNCSHCRNKGLVLTAVPRASVTIDSGGEQLRTYRFNRKVIDHLFCSGCGSQPLAQGKGPDASEMAMINLRCVPEADLDAIEMMKFDGASL